MSTRGAVAELRRYRADEEGTQSWLTKSEAEALLIERRGLLHIASCLDSLLHGVEDEETLEECQRAAEVWMVEVAKAARDEPFSDYFIESLRKDARV